MSRAAATSSEAGRDVGDVRTWHHLADVAAHLTGHGASEEEVLTALRRDAAAWSVRIHDLGLHQMADNALAMPATCDCLGTVRPAKHAHAVAENLLPFAPYIRLPNDIADWWLPSLTGAEIKVALYVCRRTIGFSREWDAISIEQFRTGMKGAAGDPLDVGTGLSRPGVRKATAGLIAKQLLDAEIQCDTVTGNTPTRYRLNPNRPRPNPLLPQ